MQDIVAEATTTARLPQRVSSAASAGRARLVLSTLEPLHSRHPSRDLQPDLQLPTVSERRSPGLAGKRFLQDNTQQRLEGLYNVTTEQVGKLWKQFVEVDRRFDQLEQAMHDNAEENASRFDTVENALCNIQDLLQSPTSSLNAGVAGQQAQPGDCTGAASAGDFETA